MLGGRGGLGRGRRCPDALSGVTLPWNHRIWPKEAPTPEVPLSAVVPDEVLRASVEG